MTTLHDRLEDLAAAAPASGAAPGDLWERGVRRGRARRAGVVVAAAAAVALIAGVATLPDGERTDPQPAEVPFEDLHLPEAVNAPGTWSDAEGPEGPLAAVGLALRTRPEGLWGERLEIEMFGVSAVDGRSEWIDLPGIDEDERGLVGWFALSPDGRWLAWSRHEPPQQDGSTGTLVGWTVMETTTGEARDLADPRTTRLRYAADLEFSGDSRYLLVSSDPADEVGRRNHQFIAYDVEDGSATVLEEPGRFWLPNLGSAPSDVVWARKRTVYRADPATGERSSYVLPHEVVTASWAPDDTAFAYIGRMKVEGRAAWQLYAGRTLRDARRHVLPLDVEPAQLLGWQDATHVVVGRFRSTVTVVDIVTGEVVKHQLAGKGKTLNTPLLAADLWQNPFTTPAPREGTTDPRPPYLWAGGGALVLVALGGVAALRWRRRRA